MISESATAATTAPPRPCTAARARSSTPCELGEPAGERGEREERDADEEQPAVAEEVAEPAAEQQEAAEGEQVRVDDPRERGLARSRGRPGSTAAPTFTIVVSSTIIRSPRQRTISASQRVRAFAWSWLRLLSRSVSEGWTSAPRETHRRREPMSFGPANGLIAGWRPQPRQTIDVRDPRPDRARRPARALRPRVRAVRARAAPAVAIVRRRRRRAGRRRASTRSHACSSRAGLTAATCACATRRRELRDLVAFMGLENVVAPDDELGDRRT